MLSNNHLLTCIRNFEGYFFRLQERFIKPSSSGGPCPEPSFPGCQEFFHNFIIAASCPVFNQHLSNTFVGKVSEVKVVEIYILSLICFTKMDFSEQNHIDEMRSTFRAKHINDNMFIEDLVTSY